MLDIVKMHQPIRAEILSAMEEVVDSGSFIGGSYVEQFESELAAYTGTARAVGASSGSDALLAALMALEVKPGDEIITTAFTFFGTAGAIVRLGARPVFADIDPVTFNIAPDDLEKKVSERTVGILPGPLVGPAAQMDKIDAVARENGLWVVEDAAQSIGAMYGDRMCGSMGTAGIYSFFPAKNLGCVGDGGAVVTNDHALAEKIAVLRNHGSKPRYYHRLVGGNFRLASSALSEVI